jgi:hypothetical protein
LHENHREMYEDARKLEKTLLASKRDGTDWAEVDDESARYMVSLSFRNKRGAEKPEGRDRRIKRRGKGCECGSMSRGFGY